jgi:hypothetical protein
MSQEKTLQEVAHMSRAAETIFSDFANRERFRDETNLNRLPKLLNLDPDETMEVFKALQELGMGSIVIGRRKNPTRFVWHYNLKDVANAAAGGISVDQINPLFNQTGKRIKRPATAQAEAKPRSEPTKPVASPEQVSKVFESVETQFDTEIIISRPGSGRIQKFKISPDKERLLLELLNAFTNGK